MTWTFLLQLVILEAFTAFLVMVVVGMFRKPGGKL